MSFVPYLALVWLGIFFLSAQTTGEQISAVQVHKVVNLLVMAFLSKLFFHALSLIITHFADMKLRFIIRQRIVERLSHVPLAWFSQTDSGKIRNAVQDDTKTVHTVVAHAPVDMLNGVLAPLVLLNLTLNPNTITALIGPSGSGKSTLATLIARFDDPQNGSISLGGVDLRDISSQTLYDKIAFVLQDPMLINASIQRNISLARQDASIEEIRKAAKIAQIDDLIMSLPKGYDSVIGNGLFFMGEKPKS